MMRRYRSRVDGERADFKRLWAAIILVVVIAVSASIILARSNRAEPTPPEVSVDVGAICAGSPPPLSEHGFNTIAVDCAA
jgi:hypothetical protein